jgi:predicted nucleic acid-binding protein
LSYLVDTNVLSEIRKTKANAAVQSWARITPTEQLFVSVISVGELENGADRVRRRDPAFAAALDEWIAELIMDFGDNVLPVSLPVARRWGRLTALGRNDTDVLIAATAIEYGLTVATRNTRHFVDLGVPVYDPFS